MKWKHYFINVVKEREICYIVVSVFAIFFTFSGLIYFFPPKSHVERITLLQQTFTQKKAINSPFLPDYIFTIYTSPVPLNDGLPICIATVKRETDGVLFKVVVDSGQIEKLIPGTRVTLTKINYPFHYHSDPCSERFVIATLKK